MSNSYLFHRPFSLLHCRADNNSYSEYNENLVFAAQTSNTRAPKCKKHCGAAVSRELSQTKEQAVALVKKLSAKYKSKYALTPRFAIATDPETMKETSKLAKKEKCFMQSHLCETKNEIDNEKNEK